MRAKKKKNYCLTSLQLYASMAAATIWLLSEMESLMQVKVSNYWEAIGVIAAHKAGLDPHSLRKDRISNISCTSGMLTNGTAVSRATPITR